MSDERTHPPEPEDLGPPAVELQRLVEIPDDGFWSRLRARIERKEAAGQWLDFSVQVFGAVLGQFLDLLFSAFPNSSTRK